MIQALTLNPVTELAEEPTAALPNPDAKKTPEKIKFRTYYFVYISVKKTCMRRDGRVQVDSFYIRRILLENAFYKS